MMLKDKAHSPGSETSQFFLRFAVQRKTTDFHLAARGPIQASQNVQQGRFAYAGRTGDADRLLFAYIQKNPP
jgi:hypothetical protein